MCLFPAYLPAAGCAAAARSRPGRIANRNTKGCLVVFSPTYRQRSLDTRTVAS